MGKKVLITGANGLIGKCLFNNLLGKGYSVVGVDNNYRKGNVLDNRIIQKDCISFLKDHRNDFDYIFHFAAINGTDNFYNFPNSVLENNIQTDLSVFKFAESNPDTQLIYASSSEIVADCDIIPTPEITDVNIKNIHNPRWSYRLGKIAAENYLCNSPLNYLIVRFFNVFSADSRSGHFLHDIIEKIKKEDYFLIGPEETRSFCYIKDAIDALVNILGKIEREIINIGNDEEIKIIEAADIISDLIFGKQIKWQFSPSKQGSTLRRSPNIEKLKLIYPSYNPTTFKEAIREISNEIYR